MDQIVKDPVCGMMVSTDSFPLDYLDMHFSFCSTQCKERFMANPHLYIGIPGTMAPKQEGQRIIKRRRFSVDQPLSDSQSEKLKRELSSMMGIEEVQVSGESVEIAYDLLQATAAQLEERIASIGLQLGGGWGDRLRRGFIHYLEECEVSALEITPPRDGAHHH